MSYRLENRLKRLETQEQKQQEMPKLVILWDDEKLPWDAPDNCLVIRLARHKHMTPAEIAAEWNKPVEREAPLSHRQRP